MRVISLQVGLPRTLHHVNRDVTTSIFKSPVRGPRLLRRLNLDGDLQSDLTVHGGKNKAVYAYPSEHYEYWRKELPGVELTWGNFGENFTTEGLLEQNAGIGDRFRIGGAVVKVTQPRFPCYKLGIRFDRADMVKRFWASRRSGIYFSVVEEGFVDTGDTFERIHEDERRISVADINLAYENPRDNLELLQRIVSLEVLPSGLHAEFSEVLASLNA
ncbi:MAG TPA: MOSC domain-containing protein [Candidatus Acidoferrales bacterium]|nr:MOSC domain-containing protein [Candidatus Acidoferrales bacterium]